MIQIVNKGTGPASLAVKSAQLRATMETAYDADEAGYQSGESKFEFTGDYRSDEVKKALIACQYNKCCFSEAKFTGDYSNVEHFRPKGRVDTYPKGQSMYPGYYWLAYEWSNLFLCKSKINSSDKRNFFPISNETHRNKSHRDNNTEDCCLIDCASEDPRRHIRFHNETPYGVDDRGTFNIDFFQLKHSEFTEARLKTLTALRTIKRLVEIAISKGCTPDELNDDIEFLRKSMLPDSEFSSMAIDFLSGWRHL